MAVDPRLYIVVGRSRDCDLVLSDPSVSGRHARLSWRGDRILVEDLGSANGTWVDGARIAQVEVRPGAELTLGSAAFSWSDPALKAFLRRGARGDTLIGARIPGRRFVCGSCGARGVMPVDLKEGRIRCSSCNVSLVVGGSPVSRWAPIVAPTLLLVASVGAVAWVWSEAASTDRLQQAAERLGLSPESADDAAASPQERAIRRRVAPRVKDAIDPTHPDTRNAAVRIAAENQGPYHVEQVARIWSHVRGRWRYVNDPSGDEFFAKASDTIARNAFAGDCDDFAIVLAAMVEAIGGRARIVMLDGEEGGHAYAEVCVPEPAEQVAERLSVYYRQTWDEYLGRQRLTNIHFRSSESCPVWLNLDWNARVPGGAYGREFWAVAIYPDGRTETLAPSAGPSVDPAASQSAAASPSSAVRASALPPAPR
jgi:hypothetical protein